MYDPLISPTTPRKFSSLPAQQFADYVAEPFHSVLRRPIYHCPRTLVGCNLCSRAAVVPPLDFPTSLFLRVISLLSILLLMDQFVFEDHHCLRVFRGGAWVPPSLPCYRGTIGYIEVGYAVIAEIFTPG